MISKRGLRQRPKSARHESGKGNERANGSRRTSEGLAVKVARVEVALLQMAKGALLRESVK